MARVGLSSNRKFLRLARALGSRVLARGTLELLWEPCFEVGDPYCGTADDIEAVCDWQGARGALTKALLEAGAPKGAGFIEPYEGHVRDTTEPHYQVHDFFHHCPEYARARRDRELEQTTPKVCECCGGQYFSRLVHSRYCGDRCRQAAHRGVSVTRDTTRDTTRDITRDVTRDIRDTTRDTPPAATSDTGSDEVPVTHVTQPKNPATASNERPRHALSRTVTICHGTPTPTPTPTPFVRTVNVPYVVGSARSESLTRSEPAAPDTEVPGFDDDNQPNRDDNQPSRGKKSRPAPDTSPVVLTFPVRGEPGPEWHLREAQVARWRALYPGLDIVEEARHALAWIEADLTRRKSAGGMPKCLVAWLNRSINSPKTRGPTTLTGSLKTAGNAAALKEFLRGRGHVVD
jgi:hypothetical protein